MGHPLNSLAPATRIDSYKFRFGIGDTVYITHREQKQKWQACEVCDGNGRVSIKAALHLCPKCRGRGGEHIHLPPTMTADPTPYTVGQLRLELTSSPGVEGNGLFDNYKPKQETIESYMLVETGIGTGTIWYAERLSATFEEAEALAARQQDAEDHSILQGGPNRKVSP